MKPRRYVDSDFMTIEGVDYNSLRVAESLAREEFGTPENQEMRRLHLQTLFPKSGDVSLSLVDPGTQVLRELL